VLQVIQSFLEKWTRDVAFPRLVARKQSIKHR